MQFTVVLVGLVVGVIVFVLGVATETLWWYAAGVLLLGASTAAYLGLGRTRPRTQHGAGDAMCSRAPRWSPRVRGIASQWRRPAWPPSPPACPPWRPAGRADRYAPITAPPCAYHCGTRRADGVTHPLCCGLAGPACGGPPIGPASDRDGNRPHRAPHGRTRPATRAAAPQWGTHRRTHDGVPAGARGAPAAVGGAGHLPSLTTSIAATLRPLAAPPGGRHAHGGCAYGAGTVRCGGAGVVGGPID
jgi:hypothetical protein